MARSISQSFNSLPPVPVSVASTPKSVLNHPVGDPDDPDLETERRHPPLPTRNATSSPIESPGTVIPHSESNTIVGVQPTESSSTPTDIATPDYSSGLTTFSIGTLSPTSSHTIAQTTTSTAVLPPPTVEPEPQLAPPHKTKIATNTIIVISSLLFIAGMVYCVLRYCPPARRRAKAWKLKRQRSRAKRMGFEVSDDDGPHVGRISPPVIPEHAVRRPVAHGPSNTTFPLPVFISRCHSRRNDAQSRDARNKTELSVLPSTPPYAAQPTRIPERVAVNHYPAPAPPRLVAMALSAHPPTPTQSKAGSLCPIIPQRSISPHSSRQLPSTPVVGRNASQLSVSDRPPSYRTNWTASGASWVADGFVPCAGGPNQGSLRACGSQVDYSQLGNPSAIRTRSLKSVSEVDSESDEDENDGRTRRRRSDVSSLHEPGNGLVR